MLQTHLEAYLLETLNATVIPHSQRGKHRPGVRLHDSGLNRMRQRQQQYKEERESRARAAVAGLTFKPAINKSRSPVLTASQSSNVFDRLYNGGDPGKHNCSQTGLRSTQEPDVLRKAFTPLIGRSPMKERPSDIFEHLHTARPNHCSRSPISKPAPTLASSNSTKLIRRIKRSRFQALFDHFQPRNGTISRETIRTAEVSEELREILSPLLDELEATGEELSLREFSEALESLAKMLTPEERQLLIFPQKHKKQTTPLNAQTFKRLVPGLRESSRTISIVEL